MRSNRSQVGAPANAGRSDDSAVAWLCGMIVAAVRGDMAKVNYAQKRLGQLGRVVASGTKRAGGTRGRKVAVAGA